MIATALLSAALLAVLLVLVLVHVSTPRRPVGLRVRGNELVFGPGRGRLVQLRGVNRSGTEYTCVEGTGLFQSPHPDEPDTAAMIAAMVGWEINVVRVPLNEDCWLGINGPARYRGRVYQRAIERYVAELNAAHLFVILDLQWVAPGASTALTTLPMADADHAPAFWRSVARTFKADHELVFDLFNEPYAIDWSCWRDGCEVPAAHGAPSYRAAGMQQLVDAVRSTGARQPLMLGGIDYGADLSGWLAHAPRDPRHQLIASEHSYGESSPCAGACLAAIADTARRVPVVLGELGELDCAHGYIDAMMRFADAHRIGYLGWAWDATSSGGWSCSAGPSLITNYDGAPTAYGVGFRDHFRALGPPVRP